MDAHRTDIHEKWLERISLENCLKLPFFHYRRNMQQQKIEFYRHNINEEDIVAVCNVLRSQFLTTGPVVAEFEHKFASWLGIPESVAVSSCTGAMHLALLRHGVGPGDEVITTPLTFVATSTAIMECGAKPVFVDVCHKCGMITPESISYAITPRTKCIIPVHLYGRMADMKGFAEIAAKHQIALIEDSAHCIEGMRDGVVPGQLSNAACFSFYATKNITCGEGGAIGCKSSQDAAWYRSARHHGIDKNAIERHDTSFQHWDMFFLGWKYNMSDIQASLMINQIERMSQYRDIRENKESIYRAMLDDIEGLEFMEKPEPGEKSAYHLFTVLLPKNVNRDIIAEQMKQKGIGCTVNYRSVHTLSYFVKTFGYRPEDFPIAYEIGCRSLTLPLYVTLSDDNITYICDTLKDIISSHRGI